MRRVFFVFAVHGRFCISVSSSYPPALHASRQLLRLCQYHSFRAFSPAAKELVLQQYINRVFSTSARRHTSKRAEQTVCVWAGRKKKELPCEKRTSTGEHSLIFRVLWRLPSPGGVCTTCGAQGFSRHRRNSTSPKAPALEASVSPPAPLEHPAPQNA